MSSISNIVSGDVKKALLNRCLSKSVLAINAGTAATVKTTSAIVFTVEGVMCSKTALSAQAITITHDAFGNLVATGAAKFVQPVLTVVYYVLSVNAAGTIAVSQGNYLGQVQTFANDIARVNIGSGAMPVEPAGYTAFGVIKVAPTVAATFDPATTALDATNVNATFYDIDILPLSV